MGPQCTIFFAVVINIKVTGYSDHLYWVTTIFTYHIGENSKVSKHTIGKTVNKWVLIYNPGKSVKLFICISVENNVAISIEIAYALTYPLT